MTDVIKEYLSACQKMWGEGQRRYEGLVLERGQTYKEYGTPIRPMTMKMCFSNCFKKATRFPGTYTYCEGWAQSIIPMHHAWLVDKKGRVVDPTWGHRIGGGYMGIEFTAEQITQEATRQLDEAPWNGFSMFYPMTAEHPLLQEP